MPVAVGLSRVFASLTPVGEARTGVACERRGLPNNAGYYHGCGLWRSLVARLTGGPPTTTPASRGESHGVPRIVVTPRVLWLLVSGRSVPYHPICYSIGGR